jgi:pimeloyl-ACP methyl ester carboxylesterase
VVLLTEKTLQSAGCKCRVFVNQSAGSPVVFLHGLSYNSEIWQRIGIFDLLKEKHVPFLALDMPYGTKSECQPKTRNEESNVSFAKEAITANFGLEKPILVGASIGGHIALKYALQFPVKGLLLIGPARTLEDDLVKSFASFRFPVRIIWGTGDNIVSGEDMRTLSDKLPNAKLVTYEGGGHSAYLSQPERFKHDLLELYAMAE